MAGTTSILDCLFLFYLVTGTVQRNGLSPVMDEHDLIS